MQLSTKPVNNNFEVNGEQFSYDYENPINEGKTKKVLKVFNSNGSESDEYCIIEEKDIVTAGDGARTETVEGKGSLTNNINSNYFEFLNDLGMKTAFVKKIDENKTLVRKLDMIPVECVYRFVSTGSHQRREKFKSNNIEGYIPKKEGEVLEEMIVDLYFKDDIITTDGLVISDPLIKLDNEGKPEIDKNGKMVLLHPDTEEKLEYDNIVKKELGEIKDSNGKIVKHFKFGFENGEFETKYIQDNNSLSFTEQANGINYIIIYNADTGEDITEIAKVTKDMISVQEINQGIKARFNDIRENSSHLIQETRKFGNGVKSLNDKVGLSTLDGKGEFGKDKDGNILFGDSLDADSNRIRKVFTVLGEDGKTYLTKDFSEEELKQSGKDSSYFENLEVIPKNIKVKKILLAAGLDKEGFRQGESGDELLKKIEKLSIYTTKALEIHNEEVARLLNKHIENIKAILDPDNIKAMSEFINNELLDILGRKIA